MIVFGRDVYVKCEFSVSVYGWVYDDLYVD